MSRCRHREGFTALYWHFGRYGRQDVHVHSCFGHPECSRVVVGAGRECDGKPEHHHRETLWGDA